MKGNIIDSLSQLSERMQQQWNCEEFFASFLKIFGTASSSIKRALNDDKAINVASHELGEKQLRTDLAIPNRVYFRFLKRDEDVRNAVDEVRALSEFRNQKFKLQYIVCCSAHLISVYDTAADEADSFSLQKLAEHCSIFLGRPLG